MSQPVSNTSQLATIFPIGEHLVLQDTDVHIKPFKFGEMAKVFKLLAPLGEAMSSSHAALGPMGLVTALFGHEGDEIFHLCALVAKQPLDWVHNLDMDEAVDLMTAIVEVNHDFFIRKVVPMLVSKLPTEAAEKLTAHLNQAGQTLSSD